MNRVRLFIFVLSFFCLSTANSQNWTQLTNVGGSVRNAASGFSIGNYGYIGLGYDGAGMVQDFWKYDPVANTWTQVANFGGAGRFGAVSFSIGTKGYCGLGSTGYPAYNFVTDFYEYDAPTNTWTQLGNFPGPGRYTVASFVINNKGYMGTGWAPYYDDFWEYNPVTDTWLQKANFIGGARQSTVGFSIGNNGYIGTGNNGANFADFYKYDPATNAWTAIAIFPGAVRYGSISFVIGNTAYVGTGGNGVGYFSNFYSYDVGTNSWTAIASYPGPGVRHAPSFTIGNCGYFGTGVSASGITNTFWKFCPCNTVVTIAGPSQACAGSQVAFTNNSTGASSYLWQFGDGDSSTSSATTITHSFTGTGVFHVKLIGQSTCGNDTDEIILNVTNVDVNFHATDISCFGAHDGSASVLNPAPGQTYTWNPGNLHSAMISNLDTGSYTLDVVDSLGCLATVNFYIIEPPALSLNISSQNTGCHGPGQASASVAGGIPPYQYSWNTIPVTNTSSVTGLDSGTYIVNVHDLNGCPISDTATILFDSLFSVQLTTSNATCAAHDGNINIAVSGTGNFTYDWIPNVSSGTSASNLVAGAYSVTVTNQQNGCSTTVWGLINGSSTMTTQIQNVVNATCSNGQNGSASVLVTGGQLPYNYLWTPGNQTTPIASNLDPGFYTVRVEDYIGCPAFDSVTIGYNFPAPIVDLGPDTNICQGDTLILDAGPGMASYQWTGGAGAQTLIVTSPGTYSVLVTSLQGCHSIDVINVSSFSCMLINSASTINKNEIAGFKIYPNPTYDGIYISSENTIEKESEIIVTDQMGKIIYNGMYNIFDKDGSYISLSGFSDGLYTLKITAGEKFLVAKVIKLTR